MLSASQTMFNIIGAIVAGVPGKNMVVSCLEHPSGFDSVQYYAERYGLELRVCRVIPLPAALMFPKWERLVEDTVLLSCMYPATSQARSMIFLLS
ncbi:MAG: hypothetical protein V8S96_08640 [Lachnospiraceae bacterium]